MLMRRVGENESAADAPHEGHEVESAGISFWQTGQAFIGSGFYQKISSRKHVGQEVRRVARFESVVHRNNIFVRMIAYANLI